MHIFVTGASGWVGSHVVAELIQHGYSVTGLARSEASAAKIEALGANVIRGVISDLELLKKAAKESDGTIHCAFNHDFFRTVSANQEEVFKKMLVAAQEDHNAIKALVDALAGTNKPFVATFGVAGLVDDGQTSTESDRGKSGPTAYRKPAQETVIEAASKGVRSAVLRLPLSVHGTGDRGFISAILAQAEPNSAAVYPDAGQTRFSAVHVTDAASAFRLVVEKGKAGAIYHAVAENVPTKDIAESIGKRVGVKAVGKPKPEAIAALGPVGPFFVIDTPASSERTQAELGWKPVALNLLQDIETNY